jgi:hypothetical protein
LIIDLGYFSLKLFHEINRKGAYFLSRLRMDTRIFEVVTQKEIDLLKLLPELDSDEIEFEIIVGKARKL